MNVMTIEQAVDIPADHRLFIDVPPEVPAGRAILAFTPAETEAQSGVVRTISFEGLDRITQTPGVMGGKPCIRGMRLPVSRLVSQISAGETAEELLVDYPFLEREDIVQALQYAAAFAQCREAGWEKT